MHSFANDIVLFVIVAILASLGWGLFSLLFHHHSGTSTFRALAVRIGLSMFLFLGLVVAIYMGWIIPAPPPL